MVLSTVTRKLLPTILIPSASAALSCDSVTFCEESREDDNDDGDIRKYSHEKRALFGKKKGATVQKRVSRFDHVHQILDSNLILYLLF